VPLSKIVKLCLKQVDLEDLFFVVRILCRLHLFGNLAVSLVNHVDNFLQKRQQLVKRREQVQYAFVLRVLLWVKRVVAIYSEEGVNVAVKGVLDASNELLNERIVQGFDARVVARVFKKLLEFHYPAFDVQIGIFSAVDCYLGRFDTQRLHHETRREHLWHLKNAQNQVFKL